MRDLVAVYNAANNAEALLLRELLLSAGIDAHTVEDISPAGAWMFGLLPEIHKPQVWVERSDVDRAKSMLIEFEQHRAAGTKPDRSLPVDVVCDECQKISTFPASRVGAVEVCSHCGAYVDVGQDVGFEGWEKEDPLDRES